MQTFLRDATQFQPLLLQGIKFTLIVALGSLALSTVLGLVWALMRVSGIGWLATTAKIVDNTLRGIPILVQLFYIYFVLPEFGIALSALQAAIIGLGIAYSASITPGGRLLRRSSGAEDRPALFAAQFALSHVCWLVAYPLAGQTGALGGMGLAFAAAAILGLLGTITAFLIWPRDDPEVVAHDHDGLPPDHPHLVEGHPEGRTAHAFMIDELHPHWPIR